MGKTLRKVNKKQRKTVSKGKGKGKSKGKPKKQYRPKCKKMKGGALLFPSVHELRNGMSSTFTGLYNSVQGNTPVHSSSVFEQPMNNKI